MQTVTGQNFRDEQKKVKEKQAKQIESREWGLLTSVAHMKNAIATSRSLKLLNMDGLSG